MHTLLNKNTVKIMRVNSLKILTWSNVENANKQQKPQTLSAFQCLTGFH